jgi:RNA recognition motif-containing protein
MIINIGNLNPQMRGNDLREEFSIFGEIIFARVVLDRETKKSKRFGFVEFANPIDADRAVLELNNQEVWGYKITVAFTVSDVIRKIAIGWLDIHKITPRQFEELITELLKNFGYKCELTPFIKDGGKDIIAIQTDGVLTNKIYVECKHHSKPVGINYVKILHSTFTNNKVTKGIIVTNSRFTKGAQEFIKENRWVLESKDCDDVFNWIKQYMITKFNYNEDEAHKLAIFGLIEDDTFGYDTLMVKDENAF